MVIYADASSFLSSRLFPLLSKGKGDGSNRDDCEDEQKEESRNSVESSLIVGSNVPYEEQVDEDKSDGLSLEAYRPILSKSMSKSDSSTYTPFARLDYPTSTSMPTMHSFFSSEKNNSPRMQALPVKKHHREGEGTEDSHVEDDDPSFSQMIEDSISSEELVGSAPPQNQKQEEDDFDGTNSLEMSQLYSEDLENNDAQHGRGTWVPIGSNKAVSFGTNPEVIEVSNRGNCLVVQWPDSMKTLQSKRPRRASMLFIDDEYSHEFRIAEGSGAVPDDDPEHVLELGPTETVAAVRFFEEEGANEVEKKKTTDAKRTEEKEMPNKAQIKLRSNELEQGLLVLSDMNSGKKRNFSPRHLHFSCRLLKLTDRKVRRGERRVWGSQVQRVAGNRTGEKFQEIGSYRFLDVCALAKQEVRLPRLGGRVGSLVGSAVLVLLGVLLILVSQLWSLSQREERILLLSGSIALLGSAINQVFPEACACLSRNQRKLMGWMEEDADIEAMLAESKNTINPRNALGLDPFVSGCSLPRGHAGINLLDQALLSDILEEIEPGVLAKSKADWERAYNCGTSSTTLGGVAHYMHTYAPLYALNTISVRDHHRLQHRFYKSFVFVRFSPNRKFAVVARRNDKVEAAGWIGMFYRRTPDDDTGVLPIHEHEGFEYSVSSQKSSVGELRWERES